MCYSGKCKYEQYYGDCTIYDGLYPEDALCVECEKEIERLRKKNETFDDSK